MPGLAGRALRVRGIAHEERTGRAWTRRPPGGLVPRHRGRQLGDAARHAGPGGDLDGRDRRCGQRRDYRETGSVGRLVVVSPGQRHQARGYARVRQRALLPGQPERPVRPGADAEPAELLHRQRHVPVQQPHAAHRAHRRQHPDHADRPVRRPARHADLQQLPGLQRGRPERQLQHHRPGGLVRLLDRPGLRHQEPAERRPRHQPEHGLLAGAAGHRGAPRGAGHRHPGALGAVHPGRLRRRRGGHGQPGAGEHRGRHPQGVRRRVAGRPAAERRHRLVQGRRDRGLRGHRRALRPGQRVLRRRQGGEVRADQRVADRGGRPAAGRARRVQRIPGPVRPPVRRARSSARARRTCPVTASRSPTPPGT